MGFFISRQRDYQDNCLYIEVAAGGKTKAGVDILTARYENEQKNVVDPRGAIRIATDIYKHWDRDYADEKKQLRIVGLQAPIVYDCTPKGLAAAKDWADRTFAAMKKCGNKACGKALGNREPYEHSDLSGQAFCCEACIARKYRDTFGIEIPRIVKDNKSKGVIIK